MIDQGDSQLEACCSWKHLGLIGAHRHRVRSCAGHDGPGQCCRKERVVSRVGAIDRDREEELGTVVVGRREGDLPNIAQKEQRMGGSALELIEKPSQPLDAVGVARDLTALRLRRRAQGKPK